MFHQRDYLLDQIEAFAAGLAGQLLGQGEITEVALSGDEVAAAAGLSLDVLEGMPVHAALHLLTTPEGLSGPRALALSMGLVERCLEAAGAGDGERASHLADKASALAEAALEVRPDLASRGVKRVIELLGRSS